MSTGRLFPDEPGIQPRHLAHRLHPETSKDAARKLVQSDALGAMMAHALDALRRLPGSTAAELDEDAESHGGQIRKRLNDLRRDGLAHTAGTRTCRVTGRRAQLWYPGVGE